MHVVCRNRLVPVELQAALSSSVATVASVRLPDRLTDLPPAAILAFMSALAGTASTLTALHGLPVWPRHVSPSAALSPDFLPSPVFPRAAV